MQFMLLIYEPNDVYEGQAGEALATDIIGKHMALATELRASGIQRAGDGLQGRKTAKTVATTGGRQTVHDGPFAETREELGGYYLIEVADMDAALAIAHRIPVPDGGKIEVRPLLVY